LSPPASVPSIGRVVMMTGTVYGSAFPCPNPLRRTAARRAQPVRDSYQCVPCLFGPSLPKPLAARAVMRSSIPLEEFACLANAGRVHLRIAESPWEGPA